MAKIIGNIKITPQAESEGGATYFEVVFMPYHGRLNTLPVKKTTQDELVEFLIEIKISEDEASRWAGRARSTVVLIPGVERTEALLKENGLIA